MSCHVFYTNRIFFFIKVTSDHDDHFRNVISIVQQLQQLFIEKLFRKLFCEGVLILKAALACDCAVYSINVSQ